MSNAPAVIDWAGRTVPNLEVLPMGVAGHHAPEDTPREIAGAISNWLACVPVVTAGAFAGNLAST